MEHKRSYRTLASLLAVAMLAVQLPAISTEASVNIGDPVLYWNDIALQIISDDSNETYGEAQQNNPGATSRALGMFHASIYDAVNSISRTHEPYLTLVPVQTGSGAIDSAVAYAAHGVLTALYSNQQSIIDTALQTHMADVPDSDEKTLGAIVGRIVATEILATRDGDGSEIDGPYTAGEQPGDHRVDPLNPDQYFWGPTWGDVTPFMMQSGSQFRAPEPPAITTQQYADAYNEVKTLGGDGVITPTTRSADQTEAGIYWAYDGAKKLGTPPRFYNQIAREIVNVQGGNTVEQNARLFALMNLAVADAGISAWDSKFHYGYWRPVVGIREAEPGTGPTGLGDGNADTEGDPTWTPLSSPASNESGRDFTPPFPTYPSGHATFGAAAFGMLRNYYGTDDIAFTMTSDELNGVTTDTNGNVRPHSPRSFTSLSQAADENGMSRVYLGIHWNFDSTSGVDMGNQIADYAFANFLQPAQLPADPCAQENCITLESYDLYPDISAPSSVERDSTFSADFRVENSGPGTATGVTLTVDVPETLEINSALPGSCAVQSGSLVCSDLTVSSTQTFSLEFTVPASVSCPDTVVFDSTVTDANGKEYNQSNNTSNAEVQIECEPENDIAVSLSGPSRSSIGGGSAIYTVRVVNHGPAVASSPSASVPLVSGMTFNSADSSNECTLNGANVRCSTNTIAVGDHYEFRVAFAPLSSLACGTEKALSATASSGEKDANQSNNRSSTVRTEFYCNATQSTSGGSGGSQNFLDRDTVGNSQSPGATRGKGTTEAQLVLDLLAQRNGMGQAVSRGGHYRLASNAPTLSRVQVVAADRVVITDGYTQAERNLICGMKRYMEDQDPRGRKTDDFKQWLVRKIADQIHRSQAEVEAALSQADYCGT